MTTTDVKGMSAAQLRQALKEKQQAEKAEKEATVGSYEKSRETYVDTVFGKMEEFSAMLREFKGESIKLGLELHSKMHEVYGRKAKEGIDNYTLTSKDGKRKVVIERSHVCQYDERAEVAIAQIKEVMRDKFSARNKGMYDMLESVLMKNNKGEYDERLVAKLRKHAAAVDNDQRFIDALALLTDSYRPVASQLYIRAYTKNDAGKWVDLAMNWSSM